MTTGFVRSFFMYIDFHTNGTWGYGGIRVAHFFFFFFFFFLPYHVPLRSEFRVSVLSCPLRFPHKKRYSVRLYLQLLVGELMSYLCYLCLFGSSLPPVVCRRVHVLFTLFVFAYALWCLTYIFCCVFVLFFLVLCDLCCQFLSIFECPFFIL